MKLLKDLYNKYKEIVLYLIFGGLTTLINILSYALLTKVFKLNWTISNVLAWILSVLFAYVTNKKFVFENDNKNVTREIISFFGFRLLSLGIDMMVMFILLNLLNVNDLMSKLIVQILVIILNYLFSKVFVFCVRK